ncbi:MAG: hypothetical protein Ta2B_26390 [Termitinemataceae bacterium]|nr:MAG: hypothetical protein Ta2B_26390 [Termitinemataceae bacterium]
MRKKVLDKTAYKKICSAFKKQKSGLTIADITAKTALPLQTVKELVPIAADEFGAHLKVTESGEILYTFSGVWSSKYKSITARFACAADKFVCGLKITAAAIFKLWIMIMLIGYFVFFLLLAIAALFVSIAASSQSKNNRRSNSGGALYFVSGLFDLFIRIWFYSELTKSYSGNYNKNEKFGRAQHKPKGKPLHNAIFSFVFGDGNPNADIDEREKRALIAYIQANKGVITLPEFMIFTALAPVQAENKIIEYCAEYGGSPQASDDGIVVYHFDELLLRAEKNNETITPHTLGSGHQSMRFSAPLKYLTKFSSNESKMNSSFCFINGINLLFGGYFLNFCISVPQGPTDGAFLFELTHNLFSQLFEIVNPMPIIFWGLGIVPVAFSVLFWLIPAIRLALFTKENETIKADNLRKCSYSFIYEKPLAVKSNELKVAAKECSPANLSLVQDKIVKEIGAYSMPQVSVNEKGETIYSYNDLQREKQSLAKYRSAINTNSYGLGDVIFET